MKGEIEEYFTVSFSLLAFEYCYFSCLSCLVPDVLTRENNGDVF